MRDNQGSALVIFIIIIAVVAIGAGFVFSKKGLPIVGGNQKTGELVWVQTGDSARGGLANAEHVAVDNDGLYVVIGKFFGGNDNQGRKIEKRSIKDGSLLWQQNAPYPYTSIRAFNNSLYLVGQKTEYYNPPKSILGEGSVRRIIDSNIGWIIEKRNPETGVLIWEKNVNSDQGSGTGAVDLVVDNTGLYVVGNRKNPTDQPYNLDYQWVIEKRDLATGDLVWVQISDPTNSKDIARGIAIDGENIYVLGEAEAPYRSDSRVEKRSKSTGSLIWGKNVAEKLQGLYMFDIAVDGTGFYVVGSEASTTEDNKFLWGVEKRSLDDGSVLWHKVAERASDGATPHPGKILSVDGSIYIAGYEMPGFTVWMAEKRSALDGAVIWSMTQGEAGFSGANDIAIDDKNMYIVGMETSEKNVRWRIEKRVR